MEDDIDVVCPYCGEPGAVSISPGEEDETFVQDCAVCCRPWQVRVRRRRDGTAEVTVGTDSD